MPSRSSTPACWHVRRGALRPELVGKSGGGPGVTREQRPRRQVLMCDSGHDGGDQVVHLERLEDARVSIRRCNQAMPHHLAQPAVGVFSAPLPMDRAR
jgi:hypothetical protein